MNLLAKALRPIETRWKGYRFRSRLEARWAVFFDLLKLRWAYEVEGYHLPKGDLYLPDFQVWTPQGVRMFVEIKPETTTQDPKFDQLQEALRWERSWLASGDPLTHLHSSQICPRCGCSCPRDDWGHDVGSLQFTEQCVHCDQETPGGGDHPLNSDGLMGCSYRPHKGLIYTPRGEMAVLSFKLKEAAEKARSARFEHGESP